MTTLNPQLAESHPEWLSVPRPAASPASKSEKTSRIDREYHPWAWRLKTCAWTGRHRGKLASATLQSQAFGLADTFIE
jgi:hypothetical protein